MEIQNLKELIKQGFAAMKAGSKIAAEATDEIQSDVKNEELKNALKQGNEQSKVWAQRIDRGLEEAGGNAEQENEILKAHFEVSKKIRQQAQDDDTRDLGIITSGQLALHYWIAAFGTQASYASAVGLNQAQQEMQACLDEAKQADVKAYPNCQKHFSSTITPKVWPLLNKGGWTLIFSVLFKTINLHYFSAMQDGTLLIVVLQKSALI